MERYLDPKADFPGGAGSREPLAQEQYRGCPLP